MSKKKILKLLRRIDQKLNGEVPLLEKSENVKSDLARVARSIVDAYYKAPKSADVDQQFADVPEWLRKPLHKLITVLNRNGNGKGSKSKDK